MLEVIFVARGIEEYCEFCEERFDFFIRPHLRKVEIRLGKAFFQVFSGGFCEWIRVEVGRAVCHVLKISIRLAFREIAKRKMGGVQ